MTTFTDEVRETVSPHKFGDSRAAAALWLSSLESGQDEETGSTEWDVWVARFGRRLLCCDDQGFVWVNTFPTEHEAQAAFNKVDAEYAEWDDDDPMEVVVGCEGCGGYRFASERFCANCKLSQITQTGSTL